MPIYLRIQDDYGRKALNDGAAIVGPTFYSVCLDDGTIAWTSAAPGGTPIEILELTPESSFHAV
jgi:hypothetical protein